MEYHSSVITSHSLLLELQAEPRLRVDNDPRFLRPVPLLHPGSVAHIKDHGKRGIFGHRSGDLFNILCLLFAFLFPTFVRPGTIIHNW